MKQYAPPWLRHPFVVRLVAGIVLLNLLAWGLAGFTLYESGRAHEARVRDTVRNLSLLQEREISSLFERIDLGLHTVVDQIEDRMGSRGLGADWLTPYLAHYQAHLPEIISLRVTDADGIVRHGEGVLPGSEVNLSDRPHFVLQKGNPQAGLVIAPPVQARISREWAIPVSRRIIRADGEFAGIVYANIPVSYLVKRFSALNLGPGGLVALRSAEHLSMARYPEIQEGGGAIGQFAISEQLRRLLQDNPSQVTYVAPSPSDGIERTFAYSRLAAYPLYVVVGLATEDMREQWGPEAGWIGRLALLFSLGSGLFGGLLLRSWSRQQKTEAALREVEQRWSLALAGGKLAVWDWNLVTDELYLSDIGWQMFGYEPGEVDARLAAWTELCHPQDRERAAEALKEHFRQRTPAFDLEVRLRGKDGNWRWIHVRGRVVTRQADGKPLRMTGTYVDISERRLRENELRLASAVFNIADEAMVVTGPDNRIVAVNPAFSAITGYTAEEVLGRNPNLLSAKTHPKAFYQDMWYRLLNTGGWSGEVLNRKKSGEVYVEWLSIKRVLDEQGQLTHHVAVFSDITARKAAEGRIRHLALHDALTNLPNRALLAERLEQAIVRARRDKTRVGLLYFDLDKFKPINDTHGHEVGDLLLKAVARRVLDCVRESDTVARIGGDEFVVLLAAVEGEQEALRVAEKIRQALAEPFPVAGHELQISSSIGLAIYPEHGVDAQTLTVCADAAMYQAKKGGRDRIAVYQHDA